MGWWIARSGGLDEDEGGGRPLLLLLLLGVAALLLDDCSGFSSSHFLRNFYTAVSEPSPGLPQFIAVSYVDDQPITHYDSHTQKKEPVASWMRKVEKVDPRFWDKESWIMQDNEKQFRVMLTTLQDHFHQNSSTGLHTLQFMCACEVGPDEQPRVGKCQYGYDGKDFLALNMETVTWMVSVPQAEILIGTLNNLLAGPRLQKSYLEEECVNSLQKYLDYRKETLQKTEPPTVKVACKKGYDDQETLVCHLYGFYPKEIEATWMKDGEDQKPDTFMEGVTRNSDGTYYTWLGINVDPKDRDRYRCHVEHDALPEALDLAWEKPASNLGLILGIPGGILAALILLWAGVAIYREKQRPEGDHKSAARWGGEPRSKSLEHWDAILKGRMPGDGVQMSHCSSDEERSLLVPGPPSAPSGDGGQGSDYSIEEERSPLVPVPPSAPSGDGGQGSDYSIEEERSPLVPVPPSAPSVMVARGLTTLLKKRGLLWSQCLPLPPLEIWSRSLTASSLEKALFRVGSITLPPLVMVARGLTTLAKELQSGSGRLMAPEMERALFRVGSITLPPLVIVTWCLMTLAKIWNEKKSQRICAALVNYTCISCRSAQQHFK